MLKKFLKLSSKAQLIGLFAIAGLALTTHFRDDGIEGPDGIRYYGTLSQDWKDQVSNAYKQFPQAERDYLIAKGVKLALGDRQSTIDPFGVGYTGKISSDPNEERTTDDQANGLYSPNKNRMAVTEYEASTSAQQINPDTKASKEGLASGAWRAVSVNETIGTMRHEFGHALDFNLLLEPSQSHSFWEAYQTDIAALGGGFAQDGGRLSYFIRLDDSSSGLHETFAEIWACVNGGSNGGTFHTKDFPAVYAWMTQFKRDLEVAYSQGPKAVDQFALSLYRATPEQAQQRLQNALDTIDKSGRTDAKDLLKLYDERAAKQSTNTDDLRDARLLTAEFIAAVVSGDPFWKHYRQAFFVKNTYFLNFNKDEASTSFKAYIASIDATLNDWGQQSFIGKLREINRDAFENFKEKEALQYRERVDSISQSTLDSGGYAISARTIADILTSDAMGIYDPQNSQSVLALITEAFDSAHHLDSRHVAIDSARYLINSFKERTPNEYKLLIEALNEVQKATTEVLRNAQKDNSNILAESTAIVKSLNDPALSQAMISFQDFLDRGDIKGYPNSGKISYDAVQALSEALRSLRDPYNYVTTNENKEGVKIDSTKSKEQIENISNRFMKLILALAPDDFDTSRLKPLREIYGPMLVYADNITADKITNNRIDASIRDERKSLVENHTSPQFLQTYDQAAKLLSGDALKHAPDTRKQIADILSDASNASYSLTYQSDWPAFQKRFLEARSKSVINEIVDNVLRANVADVLMQLSDVSNFEFMTNHAAHIEQQIKEQEKSVDSSLKIANIPALTETYREIERILTNSREADHLACQEMRLDLETKLAFTTIGPQESYEDNNRFNETIKDTKDFFVGIKDRTVQLQDVELRDALSKRLNIIEKLMLDSRVPKQSLSTEPFDGAGDAAQRPAAMIAQPGQEHANP